MRPTPIGASVGYAYDKGSHRLQTKLASKRGRILRTLFFTISYAPSVDRRRSILRRLTY
jgi:hypothetical protein